MTATLTLYSTWGCHLCDDARHLLEQAGANFVVVDIVDDSDAFSRYRTEIPVVCQASMELKWPFDAMALQHFLAQLPKLPPTAAIQEK